MVQWINLLQSTRSVLQTVSTFVILKTGIHLVLVGLIAGRPLDKKLVVLERDSAECYECVV